MYYSTENLANAAGISPAATRHYLKAGGFTPKITENRYPRHSRVYSWPDTALPYLRSRLKARPISSAPNPLRWLSSAEAGGMLNCSQTHLRRLAQRGRIKCRRYLIQTKKGARWFSYYNSTDLQIYLTHRLPKKRKKSDMQQHLPLILLRAWLVLLSTTNATAQHALAIYKPNAANIRLHLEDGRVFLLPLNNPESCAELPDSWLTMSTCEAWHEAEATCRKALADLAERKNAYLTISAASLDLWARADHTPLAQYPLPVPCHG